MPDRIEREGAAELEVEFSRLGDAQVARLLALVALPALSARGPARRLVRSAIARLVRAGGGGLDAPAPRAAPAQRAAPAIAPEEARGAAAPLRVRIYARPRSR
jgi:hypothetical protein